jgi:hypothetical protein
MYRRFASTLSSLPKPATKRVIPSIIKLTPAAVTRLAELMRENGEYLKVGTKKKGCSGNGTYSLI